MKVYELDSNSFFIGFVELTEDNKDTLNYTTVPMTIGYYKPKFNHDINDWEEGATAEEIEQIKQEQEANRPSIKLDELEVLKAKMNELENVNAGLLLENARHQIKIQEQEVTNANLLLEIAMLKGAML